MMAWGADCNSWDDAVDFANIVRFLPSKVPQENFVVTTWHMGDSLAELFWYAKYSERHPAVEDQRPLLLHISMTAQPAAMLHAFAVV